MLVKPISHKQHSLYSFAAIQIGFESEQKFKATLKYMKQAFGPGIRHNRKAPFNGYSRNIGDNKIWYYSEYRTRRANGTYYKIYLTTPEQLTLVSLFIS